MKKTFISSKFIVLEGLDGAGKTSAITQIGNILRSHKVQDIIFTREPGGTPLAEILRTLIKEGIDNEIITNHAELFMIYAARTQLVEGVIKPALTNGTWVISERHDFSSQAYQGGGRGISIHLIKTLRDAVLGNFRPDLTFYLDISPIIGLARTRQRGYLDRVEIESLAFFKRICAYYQSLAAVANNHIITIDANQPLAIVNTMINARLTQWLHGQMQQENH